ncbi:response regulator [Foetidibacter luteolus]|uniref:response regulator n=1 Tax=Foetidibacter luteolus TaxID=2608880 RepID=UPI00129A6586|nr:response regulator [Foetidibacter luteolus]
MPRNVLYIEDNPDAVVFFKRIINKLGDYALHTFESGDSLVQTTAESEQHQLKPEIILLDINLPGMNGFETLQYIRSRSEFKTIPVIMFTSSEDEQDIKKSYEYGANAYLVKPDNLKNMHLVLQDTFNFWLKHNVA